MSDKNKDPFARLSRRSLFTDGSVNGDVIPELGRPSIYAGMDIVRQSVDGPLEPLKVDLVVAPEIVARNVLPPHALDRSHTVSAELVTKLGDGDPAKGVGALDALDALVTAQTEARKRGRPRAADSYPGPECGLSRAQWYRERAKNGDVK